VLHVLLKRFRFREHKIRYTQWFLEEHYVQRGRGLSEVSYLVISDEAAFRLFICENTQLLSVEFRKSLQHFWTYGRVH
jgi:hypothetical protein